MAIRCSGSLFLSTTNGIRGLPAGIQYHFSGSLQLDFRRFRLFFESLHVTKQKKTVTLTHRRGMMRNKCGHERKTEAENKKRHKRKTCPAVHPPGTAVTGNRFPPKTASGPPRRRFQCRHEGFVYPVREFPRSRDSRPGPLMPEKGSLPSSWLLYHGSGGEANGKWGPSAGKTAPGGFFFGMVKFAGQVSWHGNRRGISEGTKNRTRGEPRMRLDDLLRPHPHVPCGREPLPMLISA